MFMLGPLWFLSSIIRGVSEKALEYLLPILAQILQTMENMHDLLNILYITDTMNYG
jgi:hypothetical protein